MKTQATYYEDGRVVLKDPIRIKSYPVNVELIIPDECTEPWPVATSAQIEVESLEAANNPLREMLSEIYAVLGPLYGLPDDGKTDSEKFAEELEAFYR
jgi:hypothetical protein